MQIVVGDIILALVDHLNTLENSFKNTVVSKVYQYNKSVFPISFKGQDNEGKTLIKTRFLNSQAIYNGFTKANNINPSAKNEGNVFVMFV